MRVDIPDYQTYVEFPDDTAPELIERTLRQNFPPKQKEPLTVASLRAKFVEDQSGNTDREKAAMVQGGEYVNFNAPTDTRGIASRNDKVAAERARLFARDDVPNLVSTAEARVGAGFEQTAGGLMQHYGENVTDADREKLRSPVPFLNSLVDADIEHRKRVTQQGQAIAAEGRGTIQTLNKEHPLHTRAGRILGGTVESIGANLPGMAATMATGNPVIGLTMMGAQTFGQAYDEARAKGLGIDDAIASASIQGGTEVATELLPFVSLAKYLKTGNFSKEVLKYYLADIPSEHVATAIQNATGAAYSAPNMTQEQRLDAAADYLASPQHGQDQIDTFFTTLLQGAVVGGTAKAARSGSQWYQQLKGGTTPPVLPKHEVRIPDTGVANPTVSVDDAIRAADAEIGGDWTHDQRSKLLKELGGGVEEATTEPVAAPKKGSLDTVASAQALADPMLREIETAQLTAEPFTDYPLQRPLITGEAKPAAGGIVGVEGYRQKQVEPNTPILNDEQQGIYDTFQGAPHVLKRDALEEVEANRQDQTLAEQMAAGRQQSANLPESQQNADAQIPPVAGLSEPVDTQVSPEKGVEAPIIGPDTAKRIDTLLNETSRDGVPAFTRDFVTAQYGEMVKQHGQAAADTMLETTIRRVRENNKSTQAQVAVGEKAAALRGETPADLSPSSPSPKVEAPAPVGEEAVEMAAPAVDPTTATRNVLQQLAAPKRKSDTLVSTLKDAHGKEILNQLVKQEMVRFPGQGRAEITKAGQEWLAKNPPQEQPKKARAKRQARVDGFTPEPPSLFSIKKPPQPSKGWYRYTHSDKTPLSDWGHALFVEGSTDQIAGGNYGKVGWETDASQYPHIKDLKDDIEKVLQDAAENGSNWAELDDAINDHGVDGVLQSFLPDNIVDSAGAFDNGSFTEWLWNEVLEPRGIKGVRTNDGAVVFDEDAISRFSDDDGKYSTNDNATPADLTPERVRSSFPTLPVTEDNGTFTVTTPSGIPIRISKVGEIEFGPEQRAAAEKEYGRKLRDDERPVAEFRPIDHGAVINLTEKGIGELDHEVFHLAMSLSLTERQKAAVLSVYKTEEKAAAEYQRLRDNGAFENGGPANLWLRKIYQFFRSLRELIAPTAKGVMRDIASGKVWDKAQAGVGGAKYASRGPQPHNLNAALDDLPPETKGQKFWRKMQDRYNRLSVIESYLKEKGIQLSELANVSRGLSVMNGKIADSLSRFMENKIHPLVEEAAKHKVSLGDIEEFLLMQHAEEANEQMRKLHDDHDATAFGVTDQEAQQSLADFRARADFAQLERIANKFRALSDDTANMLVREGIISQDMKDAWESAYQHYVPLRGGDEDTKQGTGKGLRVNGKQQRRGGHGRRDEHVIENIIKSRERAVKAVEKNKVALSVAQLIKEVGDGRIGTIEKPERRRIIKSQKMHTVFRNGEAVASFPTEQGAKDYIAQPQLFGAPLRRDSDVFETRLTHDQSLAWVTSRQLGENEINAYVNGHQVRIQINDEVAAKALTHGGIEELATIFKFGKMINNYLSRIYTGYDPRFTIRNTARDFTAGMINLTGDYGAKTAAKIALNYPKAVKELLKARKDPTNSQWIDRYRKAGGSTGASWLPSIERLGEKLEDAYHEQIGAIETYRQVFDKEIAAGASAMKAGIKAGAASGVAKFKGIPVLGHYLRIIEAMNSVSENAFRVATFKTLVEEGKSDREAGEAAKSSTINFDKRGELGNQIGALYLFFNPAVQGARRTGKALFESEHKFQAQAMAGSMAFVGFMAAELARSMWDDDEWDKIPRSVKNRNLVLRASEKGQITIPIPYDYGTFVGVGYALSDMAHGKADWRTGLNLAGTIMDAVSFAGNPITDKGEISVVPVVPTLMKMLLAPSVNVNNFGSEIYPDKAEWKPDSQNMYRNTKGTGYAKAAERLNELTGGTKYTSGMVDVSPEVLKFYTRAVFGGAASFVMEVNDFTNVMINKEKPEISEVPLANVVMRENTVRDTRAKFYEIASQAGKAAAAFNAAKRDRAFDIAAQLKDKDSELIAISRVASTQKKLAKAKRDALDAIRLDEDLSFAEKREKMRLIERQEEMIYDRLIRKFNQKD